VTIECTILQTTVFHEMMSKYTMLSNSFMKTMNIKALYTHMKIT